MSDLISRQAAIDALGEEPEVWTGNDEYAQGLNNQWHYDVTALKAVSSAQQWMPLHFESFGDTNFPYELDGRWVIVTDGENISVERIKKDAYDHFFPNGRWFELEDVKAWMPLPEPYAERRTDE